MGDLGAYRRKRDFAVTGEPAGGAAPAPAARFVIQEHHARRLHWDLRLERDGVLASWAVPKGLPEAPGSNHFAARTEDHPLEYIDFHGQIPAGQYGAGSMTIWDRGTYETLKWEARKVEVLLHGERIDARYALFAIGDGDAPKDWMVHRMDPPADPEREPLPARLVPMRASPGALPDGDGWAFEIRWRGVRALAYSQPGQLRFAGPALRDLTGLYPELGRLGRMFGSRGAVLDGVIVGFDGSGSPSASVLARRSSASPAQLRRLAADQPVTYVIFDLLWLDGHSLMELPYGDRREQLAGLGLADARWRAPDHVVGAGDLVLAASAAHGLGGVVAKRLDSVYSPGRVAGAWVEVGDRAQPALTGVPARGSATVALDGRSLSLTDLGRVLYPATGTTKRQVLDYYARVAPVLLGHLAGRALTVKRWPDGVDGAALVERQSPADRPGWVTTVTVDGTDHTRAEDLPTLVWLADRAALELVVPLGLAAEPRRPTAVVFDLDPGPPAKILECCDVALRLQGMFEHLGLECFALTSGADGLQVHLPLGGATTFAQTEAFARMVAELLARDEPELVVAEATAAPRAGRVFVDWAQQKLVVAAYSLRGFARPTVSTPVSWDEVRHAPEPSSLAFSYDEVLDRVDRCGDLFAPVLWLRQELPRL